MYSTFQAAICYIPYNSVAGCEMVAVILFPRWQVLAIGYCKMPVDKYAKSVTSRFGLSSIHIARINITTAERGHYSLGYLNFIVLKVLKSEV